MFNSIKSASASVLVALGMVIALSTQPAMAGRSCEAALPTARSIQQGLALAEKTHKALSAEFARNGTRVLLLARAGQDLSKYGVRFSHLGLAYRATNGQWLVAHKLNSCASDEGSIYRQGLGEFFMDDMFRFEAAWSVPTPEIQARLWPVLQDNAKVAALHTKPYSVVSYAWAQKYQQSNQWAIETLAGAMLQGDESLLAVDRSEAQAWLAAKGYEPHVLTIGPLARLGGRMTAANVAFDDHPNEKRFADRIETVTVDSVFKWLRTSQLGSGAVRVAVP